MRASLPAEITVVETSNAISYELPVWQGGRPHRATVFGLWGGLSLCCGLLFTVPVIMTWAGGQALEPVLAIGFFPVACLADLVGLLLLFYAGHGAPSRDSVELSPHGIAVVWQLGRFQRSRRVPWREIARLAIEPASNEHAYVNTDGSYLLRLTRHRGAPVQLAGADDRTRLLALAGDLARRSKAFRVDWDDLLITPSSVEIVEEAPRGLIVDRELQPSDSTAIVEQHPDGVTITFPSPSWRELFRSPAIMIALAVITPLWALIITNAAQATARNGHFVLFTRDATLVAWPWALVFSLGVTHIVNRRAQLTATGGVLTVRSRLLVGTRCRRWRREELADIRVVSKLVNSDAGRQWTQYIEIQPLDPRARRAYRLLHWREKSELEWIATTLRRVLALPATQSKPKAAAERWDDEFA